jgi:hypothetical protein
MRAALYQTSGLRAGRAPTRNTKVRDVLEMDDLPYRYQ